MHTQVLKPAWQALLGDVDAHAAFHPQHVNQNGFSEGIANAKTFEASWGTGHAAQQEQDRAWKRRHPNRQPTQKEIAVNEPAYVEWGQEEVEWLVEYLRITYGNDWHHADLPREVGANCRAKLIDDAITNATVHHAFHRHHVTASCLRKQIRMMQSKQKKN
jgi:hypothetical protein